jgi:hypothetical protein
LIAYGGLKNLDVIDLIVDAHLPDEVAVIVGGVDCINGGLIDTLGVDTLGVDTLGVDTLGPRYRIVPNPRPQINDIVFDDTSIY